ncbi:MAG: hypothetical protein ACTIJR_10455 [Brevibacterium linens]
MTTPITAGPRAVLRQRRDTPHHHEPGRAEYVEASLTAEERNGGLLGENELVAVNEDGSGYEYSK